MCTTIDCSTSMPNIVNDHRFIIEKDESRYISSCMNQIRVLRECMYFGSSNFQYHFYKSMNSHVTCFVEYVNQSLTL